LLGALDVFHVGVVVVDLDAAMARIGAGLGVDWASVQERSQPLRTAAGACLTEDLRFTYSANGHLHVELIESGPGSVWTPTEPYGLHHIGAFADDIAVAPGSGMTLEFGGGHGEIPAGFAYYTAPEGIRVELVESARRGEFDRWFSGGSFRRSG
jgi:catechol 2,3-dioxygenase-like lactoylglutathione lyase family enzyme